MGRTFFLSLISVLIGLAGTAVLAELALRFLPVNESMEAQAVDAENPILHFAPNRRLRWSRGWNFPLVNSIRVNNYGFVNDKDYRAGGGKAVLAVIGDSFVEAAMTPFAETLQGRLAKRLEGWGEVYSFGTSGAALSQYWALADFARRAFSPRTMVFVIVDNDFDESLLKYKSAPGFHYFVPAAPGRREGGLKLHRVDYRPGLLKRIARRFALARYLAVNVNIRIADGGEEGRTPPAVIEDSKDAVDAFLEMLPDKAGLEAKRILLVVDGFRQAIYEGGGLEGAKSSFFGVMRAYFMERARSRGYGVIDMQPIFEKAYARDRKPFEYPTDGHWNGYAHGLAAEAAARNLPESLIPQP